MSRPKHRIPTAAERPRDVHPDRWLYECAKAEVNEGQGPEGAADRQRWLRRVSTVYHQMLRERGVVVEGA